MFKFECVKFTGRNRRIFVGYDFADGTVAVVRRVESCGAYSRFFIEIPGRAGCVPCFIKLGASADEICRELERSANSSDVPAKAHQGCALVKNCTVC